MAEKNSSRRPLIRLFSRGDASPQDAEEEKKKQTKKKKFRFLPFGVKEEKHATREAAAEEGDSAHMVSDAPLYAITRRSKEKMLSYSELDLRKPRRFASFAFSLRRKKKEDEEKVSRSSCSIQEEDQSDPSNDEVRPEPGTEERHRPKPANPEKTQLSVIIPAPPPPPAAAAAAAAAQDQMEPAQSSSRSQLELHTADTFHIPPPPLLAANQTTLRNQNQASIPGQTQSMVVVLNEERSQVTFADQTKIQAMVLNNTNTQIPLLDQTKIQSQVTVPDQTQFVLPVLHQEQVRDTVADQSRIQVPQTRSQSQVTVPDQTRSQTQVTVPDQTRSQSQVTVPDLTRSQSQVTVPDQTQSIFPVLHQEQVRDTVADKSRIEVPLLDQTRSQPQVTVPDRTRSQSQVTVPDHSRSQSQVTVPDQTRSQSQVTVADQTRSQSQVTVPDRTRSQSQVTVPDQTQSVFPVLHQEQVRDTVADKSRIEVPLLDQTRSQSQVTVPDQSRSQSQVTVPDQTRSQSQVTVPDQTRSQSLVSKGPPQFWTIGFDEEKRAPIASIPELDDPGCYQEEVQSTQNAPLPEQEASSAPQLGISDDLQLSTANGRVASELHQNSNGSPNSSSTANSAPFPSTEPPAAPPPPLPVSQREVQGAPPHHSFSTETVSIDGQAAGSELQTTGSEPETATLEPQTAALEPETAGSEPQTTASEPQTGRSEPQTARLDPETAALEPQTAGSEPQTAGSEPQTTASEPQTGRSEPQTGRSEPQTGRSEPHTTALEPQTARSEPQTGRSEPHATALEPQTARSEPQTTASEPETGRSQPETARLEPETAALEPQTAGSEPQTTASEPQTDRSEPQTAGSEPQTTASEPQTTASEPQTDRSEPQTDRSEPQTDRSEPQTTASEPQTTALEPQTAGSEPQTAGSEPQTAGSEPQTTALEPHTARSEPQTTASEPQTGRSQPETAGSDPQTAGLEPQTAGLEPQTAGLEPQTTASEPQTGRWQPETAALEPETAALEPQTTASEPQTGRSEPQTSRSEPQTTTSEPETAALEPQTTASEPQTGRSEPQTTTSEPETAGSEPETGRSEPQTGRSQPHAAWSEPQTAALEADGDEAPVVCVCAPPSIDKEVRGSPGAFDGPRGPAPSSGVPAVSCEGAHSSVSALTRLHSHADAASSAGSAPPPPPPRGAAAQVTQSKGRGVRVGASVSAGTPPPPPATAMTALPPLEVQISAEAGELGGSDPACSPPYLSVGSDDNSSAAEVFFSAEEEDTEESERREGQRSGRNPRGRAELKDEQEEGPDTPVLQVNLLLECAPPSTHTQGAEPTPNWTGDFETPQLGEEEQTLHAGHTGRAHAIATRPRSFGAADTMSAGFSSLSTTLSVKPAPPTQEDEARLRFHKVSLVGDGEVGAGPGEGADPEYRWRNRFEGVSQYRADRAEEESDAAAGPAPSYLSHELAGAAGGWGRGLGEEAEPGTGESRGRWQAESERSAALQLSDGGRYHNDEESPFTGVFQATLVELEEPAAPPCSPPTSPDFDSPIQQDMESLVDTLRSMGPSLRPRGPAPLRAPPPGLLSSLPPIVEDASSPVTSDLRAPLTSVTSVTSPTKKPDTETLNGLYTLPADLGLKRSSSRDTRSPLELMKLGQQEAGPRVPNLPLRASASSSILMRRPSDSSVEDPKSPLLNGSHGGGGPQGSSSRLDNSVIFGSYRSSSVDQPQESGKHRSLFRTGSLPDTSLREVSEVDGPPGSRFERLSFLLNSSSSLTGGEDAHMRMSRPPSLGLGPSPPSSGSPTHLLSPAHLLSPTGSIDLPPPVFSPMATPLLQRSFGTEGGAGVHHPSMFGSTHGAAQAPPTRNEPDRNLMAKYRAFPDAYLTKEKEHGKLNPRPGKLYIFDRPGMCGQRTEVRGDVMDATDWELQETISIRVVRGGWVLYEKPNFKGEKVALDEGDIELTCPFSPPEERQQEGEELREEPGEQLPPRFIIGSIRRAVRDYSVPEISLFPEENAEGKKVIFRDTSEDARIFGFPIKANSIIINAGLWLVYAQPFFQGVPRVLEVGGFPNPAAWGVEQPYVGSLHPLKVGEPRVEEQSEPSMVIYEKPYFSGKSRTITSSSRDFMTRVEKQQMAFMYSVGSLKVQGGIWVGYEKEGFRGHQYLLEEGEYQDWRVWGGHDAELRSVRVLRADLSDPLMVMFEQPEEQDDGEQEENTFEVTEAIPDVELFGYKTSTRSIQVVSGAWVAYSHVDFSGDQFILEKGFYNNCADWGSQDTRICSVQPILLAPADSSRHRKEIILYSEPNFGGERRIFHRNQEAVTEKLQTHSCRVRGGSWVLYEQQQYSGSQYVLSEGEYPNLSSMGCPPAAALRSLRTVPTTFCVPSISLFGLECLEGREITTDTEISSMLEEGFNDHILSVRVNSGCWVVCEHSHYRGRQFLLEPIEITNWPKFSSLQTVGSMYPIRQRRHFFRIKNKERGHFLSVQGGVEEMKSGRLVVTEEVEPLSDVWFYQDGFIKSKLSPTMSLQVMGNIEQAAKVVLWSESRQPVQTWTAQMSGLVSSLTFPGMVLDVKGGKTYDRDHVVIMAESEERPSQQWEVELL